jgi:hypothetical protein
MFRRRLAADLPELLNCRCPIFGGSQGRLDGRSGAIWVNGTGSVRSAEASTMRSSVPSTRSAKQITRLNDDSSYKSVVRPGRVFEAERFFNSVRFEPLRIGKSLGSLPDDEASGPPVLSHSLVALDSSACSDNTSPCGEVSRIATRPHIRGPRRPDAAGHPCSSRARRQPFHR